MAKSLKDILAGSKSSKTVTPDLKDLAMSPEGNKGELDFAAKHKIEKHADRAGNDDKVYTGGTSKTTKYKFQKDGVYEETLEELDEKYMGFEKTKQALASKGAKDPAALAAWIGRKKYGKGKFQAAAAKGKKLGEEAGCNHSGKGVRCEMHGEDDCSGAEPKDMPKKGQKVLMDKKVKEEVENISEMPSQYRTNFGMGAKRGWASSKASKVTFQNPHPLPKGGPSKASVRAETEKLSAGVQVKKLPAGKAKGLKEEELQEVAPPNPKIEKWIKANKERFMKEYGPEKGKQVLYAKAWKMHGQSESGGATNTDYTGGTLGSTGRLDVGTL